MLPSAVRRLGATNDGRGIKGRGCSGSGRHRERSSNYYFEIFLVSVSGLLLEISYTRIISFKMFYYFAYLVIGLALLGLGGGGVVVAISGRLRRAATDSILLWSLVLGAGFVGLGYLVIAVSPINTFIIWDYGTHTITNGAILLGFCLIMFLSFLPAGIILSTLFGRRPEGIGRLLLHFDLFPARPSRVR